VKFGIHQEFSFSFSKAHSEKTTAVYSFMFTTQMTFNCFSAHRIIEKGKVASFDPSNNIYTEMFYSCNQCVSEWTH